MHELLIISRGLMLSVVDRETRHSRFILQHEGPMGNLKEFATTRQKDRLGTIRRGLRGHLEQHDASGY